MDHRTSAISATIIGHPGGDIDAADVKIWAARISERWRASIESIFETGRLLLQAKDRMPHGAFGQMCESELPFSARTAQRLMAVAQDKRLSNPTIASYLPASWTTLADLATLTDAEFSAAVDQKIIRPEMIRADVEQIRVLTRPQPILESSSAVERLPVKEDVAGSMPAFPATSDTGEPPGFQILTPPPGEVDPVREAGLGGGSPVLMPGGGLAIAHNRIESADSLDFFPTPPWATRALFEHSLRHIGKLGHCKFQTAWEPAAGQGHMVAVLEEYFRSVCASDVEDYGCGFHVADFFDARDPKGYDWIITNPPFNRSIDFVELALKRAGVGVAMFVRAAWLEGSERYERIFRDNPPTLVSFFVERVPLHKGRWEPEGATFTAYVWLVWLKGAEPRAPFWIPPGCRQSLSKPEDIEKFGKAIVEGEAA